ncbi:MAG TPA: glycosyltransferase family 39 protein [Mycobacteriales bacterium]|nr:glycosyltransferase family 39 protein [Mycobacteriales bacterium]
MTSGIPLGVFRRSARTQSLEGPDPRAAVGPRRRASGPHSPLAGWVWVIAIAQLTALLATSTRYGYDRDELYFTVAGGHLAWGYPDQPPIVPLLCSAMDKIAPGSLTMLRLPSALAAAATTVLAALIAREAGGARHAQIITAACTAVSAFALATGHFVTTTTFDLLSTTALLWLLVRAMMRRTGVPLLLAGVVAGVGIEAKPQVGIVALVALISVAAAGPRWPLRSRWLGAGVAAAVVLAAPYAIWQARHGWPQVTVAGNIGGSAEGGRAGFVPFQLVMVSPLLVPVWIAGLVAPWRRAALRPLRFLPITYAVLAVAYMVGNGKAYYLASLYPALLGLGAVAVADWTTKARERLRLGVVAAAVAVSAAVSAYIALPLLPQASLQGSAAMAINPDLGEAVGWPQFIEAVSTAWRSVPVADRASTVIFTQNYGEAAAIDLLGRAAGLPGAYSGHNAFSEWGPPPANATQVLVIGFDGPADARPQFTHCSERAVVDNHVGLDNQEQGLPIMLCRPAEPWPSLWPALTHYN